MNMQIVAIKDEATENYGQPLFTQTEREAKRMFINEVNNPQSRINRNPEDFALYSIGVYNNESGDIQGTFPKQIMRGIDAVKGEQA